MQLTLRWTNRGPWNASLGKLRGDPSLNLLEEAVGRAAIRVQQAQREQLQRMVYSQPPAAGGYVRTNTLMRATHAASPSKDHGADFVRAKGGEDLAATSPVDVVERRGNQIASEIGAWGGYFEYVHQGVNQPSPRPFVEATLPDAERALREEVERAIQKMARAF